MPPAWNASSKRLATVSGSFRTCVDEYGERKPSVRRTWAVRISGHVRAAEGERSRRFAAAGSRQDVRTGPLVVGRGVLVGTASWTDPEFIKAGWYPPDVKNDAEGRLRYYAEQFPMVEVNATFYALPTIETVAAWAERTPPEFRFHVKAHQVISGHPSDPSRLPAPLRSLPAELDAKGRIRKPSRELRDAVIDTLLESCGPLGDKLGAILVQLPPFVTSGERQREELARILVRLKPYRAAVEFRHRSWVEPGERERAVGLLSEHDAAWVCVDAPKSEAKSAMPPIVEVTSSALAYVRMHGRNATMWTRGRTVAERFDHEYRKDELEEWVAPVLDMAERAQEVAVVMNNNAKDYALVAADQFRRLIAVP